MFGAVMGDEDALLRGHDDDAFLELPLVALVNAE